MSAHADAIERMARAGLIRRMMRSAGVHDPDRSRRRTDVISPDALRGSLDALPIEALVAGDLEASLRDVVEATCAIFGAEGAGIMLIDEGQMLHYVAATDARSAALEAAQDQAGEGPCVDSLIGDHLVRTPDLLADDRWPAVRDALAPLGIRAILGIPVHVSGQAVGSLNVYRDRPAEWDDSEVEAIAGYAALIEQLIGNALLAERRGTLVTQLQDALDHRVEIERAVGVLMGRDQLGAVAAFNALRSEARRQRRRVLDVARELLADPTAWGATE